MGTHVAPPEAQLWRIVELAKLVSVLDHNALYFGCVGRAALCQVC
jgi:hypothetical protein